MITNYDLETKGVILLVDDIIENLQLLSDILLERNYTVRRVTSGKMAIKTVKVKAPDLIFLDIKMPEMDGYEVCKILKADPKLCEIPIIFISALDEHFDKVKAFTVGGVDYITKPFHIEEVLVRLESQLTIQKQKCALKEEINRRKEAEEILYQSRALLGSVLNSSLDAIAALQAVRNSITGNIEDFRCLVINPIMSKAFGGHRENLVGKVIVKRLMDRIDLTLFARFVAVVESGESLIDDLYYSLGNSCWYNFVAVKLGDGFSITVRDITIRKKAEIALQESENRFFSIFNNNPAPIWIETLEEGRYLNVNESFCQFLGMTCEEILGKNFTKLSHWNNIEDVNYFRKKLIQQRVIQNLEIAFKDQSGEIKSVLISAKIEKLKGEECIIGVMKDITDRKQFEKFLRQYERIVSAITDGIALIDDKYNYIIANQTYLNWVTKVSIAEIRRHSIAEILGQDIFNLIVKPRLDRCLAGENLQFEEWINFKNGQRRFIRAKYSPYLDIDGTIVGVVVSVHDFTELKQIEQELKSANQQLELMTNLDGLTKIANRRRFDDCLSKEWQQHLREQKPLALIFIDIDYFKRYNDYYGHQAGDECLIKVAQTIAKTTKRFTDLTCRYGGEEFVVILLNTNTQGALKVAEEIKHAIILLTLPHAKSEISQYVTLSLGVIGLIPVPEFSPDDLVAKADQALYAAKHQGRNRAVAFLETNASG